MVVFESSAVVSLELSLVVPLSAFARDGVSLLCGDNSAFVSGVRVSRRVSFEDPVPGPDELIAVVLVSSELTNPSSTTAPWRDFLGSSGGTEGATEGASPLTASSIVQGGCEIV